MRELSPESVFRVALRRCRSEGTLQKRNISPVNVSRSEHRLDPGDADRRIAANGSMVIVVSKV